MQIFGGKGRGKLIKERPPTSQQNEKLSFGSKIAFALGGLGVAIGPGTIIPFWYTFFLTDIARLDLGLVSLFWAIVTIWGRTEQPDRRLSVRPHPHPLGATAAIPAVWGVARGCFFPVVVVDPAHHQSAPAFLVLSGRVYPIRDHRNSGELPVSGPGSGIDPRPTTNAPP